MTHILTNVRAEHARIKAGHAQACGYTCACHGGYVCTREQHPHRPGDEVPHVGYTADNEPVQWLCLPTPPGQG